MGNVERGLFDRDMRIREEELLRDDMEQDRREERCSNEEGVLDHEPDECGARRTCRYGSRPKRVDPF